MADRKDRSAAERIEAREFDDPAVRRYLDALSVEAVEHRLGTPRVQVIHAEPAGHWRQGDGRPALASEDPAVMEAVGRCASARVIGAIDSLRLSAGAIHPASCGWCEYPLEELLAACDWATWQSREVVAELRVWAGAGRSIYVREGGSGFGQPAWREFWALPPKERRRRVEQAVAS